VLGHSKSGREVRRFRKPLRALSEREAAQITDPLIRRLVEARLAELDQPPKQAFKNDENLPALVARSGRRIPIRKVRLAVTESFRKVGDGPRARFVAPGANSNHHACIVEVPPKHPGQPPRWEDRVTSRFEVHERLRLRQPIVIWDWPDGGRTRFTLMRNDFLVIPVGNGGRQLLRVASISPNDIELVRHMDARTVEERKTHKDRLRPRGSDLLKRNAYKVRVSYLGEISPMND
jgi:hypothetical protein